ncbi:MAG: right-handed parallel beta-helix repeat-containing protein, partial [Planctomycetes bacterium]|nr:right-handed parallel beta-helix repeat-containing protein [Planctomycetota bacterium]
FRHAAGTATDTAVALLDSDAMDVMNCRVEWNSGSGIGYWRGAHHRLENNVVVFNGGLGIGGRFHQTILRGNETSYNNWRGALAGVFGWHFAGVKLGGATATQIERHVAVNNLARGLWLDFNVTGNVIDGAIVHGNLDRGVYLEAGTGANWLMNSLVSGTRGLGHGVTIANSPDQRLYHNTFVANGSWGLWAGGSNEPRGTQPNNSLATDLDVRCNLFHNAGAEGAIELQQRSYGGQEDYVIRSFRADGNRYHDGRREDVFLVAGRRLKLAEWQERGWDKAGVWAAVPLVAPDQLDFRPRDEKSAAVALLPRLDEAALDLLRNPRIQVVAGAFSPPQPDRADAPLPIWADVRRYAPVDEMPLLVGDEVHLPRLWQASQVRRCARDVLLASSAKAWGSDAWLKTGREGDRSIAVLLNPAPWPVDVTLETPAGSLADRVSGQRWDTAAGRLNLPLRPYQALVLEVAGAGPVRATASAPAWVGESLRKQIQSLQAKSAGNAEAAKALAAAQEALNDGRPVAAWEALQARGLRAESAELNRLLSEGRL